jgi:hypothetical protein
LKGFADRARFGQPSENDTLCESGQAFLEKRLRNEPGGAGYGV